MPGLVDSINSSTAPAQEQPNQAQAIDEGLLATIAKLLGMGKSPNAPIVDRNQEQADQLNQTMQDAGY